MKKAYYAIIIVAIIVPIPFILGLISSLFRPQLPITQRDFKVGIAGFIPRNFPNSESSDWESFYKEIPQMGEVFGAYPVWNDDTDTDGIPDLVKVAIGIESQYGVTPVIAISFDINVVTDTYFSENKEAYKAALIDTVGTYNLTYLSIGNEVNSLYAHVSPAAFNDFVGFYKEAYDEIKIKSPNTKVFTIFQLEHLKGAAYLTGLELSESWDLIDQFGEKLDLVGFTAYPLLEYSNVNQIPEDYFLEIANYVDKPVAFTEMGWPSVNVESSGIRIINSNQLSQVEFFLQILNATNTLDVELFIHPFLHDFVYSEENPLFNNIALKKNDGTPKEIFNYWQALASLPYNS